MTGAVTVKWEYSDAGVEDVPTNQEGVEKAQGSGWSERDVEERFDVMQIKWAASFLVCLGWPQVQTRPPDRARASPRGAACSAPRSRRTLAPSMWLRPRGSSRESSGAEK